MDVIEKEVFHLPVDEKTGQGFLTKEIHGGNIKALRPQSD